MNSVFNKVQLYIPNTTASSDKVTFTDSEIIEVVCDVHGWMKSWVHVVDHPYYCVTNSEGEFVLNDIPPGKYNLKVWHETLGEVESEVVVTFDGVSQLEFNYPVQKKGGRK